MTGWKTKTGAAIYVLGALLKAMGPGCPMPDLAPWFAWLGGIVEALGGALAVVGIAHKIEKGQQ